MPLGLTFSFPVEQTALDSGKLLTWTKGFSAKNAVGKDIVKLLQDAFDRKNMHVRCVALVNDVSDSIPVMGTLIEDRDQTVGTLLSRAYASGGCTLGGIFGTGTNGAYVEDLANITKLGNSITGVGGSMIVNTEWGAFNNSVRIRFYSPRSVTSRLFVHRAVQRTALPRTPFDNKLDRESINPSKQAFEKFVSGMYLGEVARNVIISLIDAAPKAHLFSGHSSHPLNKQWGLDTAVLSDIEGAWEDTHIVNGTETMTDNGTGGTEPATHRCSDLEKLQRIRDVIIRRMELAPEVVTLDDADVVRKVCTYVVSRAARLSGCAVAAVLVQTGQAQLLKDKVEHGAAPLVDAGKRIIVGVDGR